MTPPQLQSAVNGCKTLFSLYVQLSAWKMLHVSMLQHGESIHFFTHNPVLYALYLRHTFGVRYNNATYTR